MPHSAQRGKELQGEAGQKFVNKASSSYYKPPFREGEQTFRALCTA